MKRKRMARGGAEEERDWLVEATNHRRKTKVYELSAHYEQTRALSEVRLLEAMQYKQFIKGHVYNFVTAGDVSAISFVKVMLNHIGTLDHLLAVTWCWNAEDVYQLSQWVLQGSIKSLDVVVGDKFTKSYVQEWAMIQDLYHRFPNLGRICVTKNHAKIYAGCNKDAGFYFGTQLSANVNLNKRIEQASITIDKGLYDFYTDFFADVPREFT